MRTYYADCRDECLSDHTWNWAIARVAPALMTDVPVWAFSKAYALPADYLRLLDTNLDPSWGWWWWDDLAPLDWSPVHGLWQIENVDVAQVVGDPIPTPAILTNELDLMIRYVRRVVDPTRYSPYFVTALSFLLASRAAYQVTGSSSMTDSMRAQYMATLSRAKNLDGMEGAPRRIISGTLTWQVR